MPARWICPQPERKWLLMYGMYCVRTSALWQFCVIYSHMWQESRKNTLLISCKGHFHLTLRLQCIQHSSVSVWVAQIQQNFDTSPVERCSMKLWFKKVAAAVSILSTVNAALPDDTFWLSQGRWMMFFNLALSHSGIVGKEDWFCSFIASGLLYLLGKEITGPVLLCWK